MLREKSYSMNPLHTSSMERHMTSVCVCIASIILHVRKVLKPFYPFFANTREFRGDGRDVEWSHSDWDHKAMEILNSHNKSLEYFISMFQFPSFPLRRPGQGYHSNAITFRWLTSNDKCFATNTVWFLEGISVLLVRQYYMSVKKPCVCIECFMTSVT